MNSLGKCMSIAAVAVGIGLASMPLASACPDHVMTQPSVFDRTLVQPAVLDRTIVQPAVLDSCGISSCGTVMTQPAVIQMQPVLDTCGINSCGNVLTQPAIIDRPRHALIDFDLFD